MYVNNIHLDLFRGILMYKIFNEFNGIRHACSPFHVGTGYAASQGEPKQKGGMRYVKEKKIIGCWARSRFGLFNGHASLCKIDQP